MPKEARIDPDAQAIGQALKAIRERLGLRQPHVAEAAGLTAQYVSMIETGKVPGLVKPATQRKIIEALNAALEARDGRAPSPPVTISDLDAELAGVGDTPRARLARIARELTTAPDPELRQAVFPVSDGDVVISFPAHMTPEGFKELEAYFAIFLKANSRDN